LDDQDRATIQRIVAGPCTLVGPNIRLTVVAAPGTYSYCVNSLQSSYI